MQISNVYVNQILFYMGWMDDCTSSTLLSNESLIVETCLGSIPLTIALSHKEVLVRMGGQLIGQEASTSLHLKVLIWGQW